jgi:hypothetical protein
MKRCKHSFIHLIIILWFTLSLGIRLAKANDNGFGQRPYMGWSSWSLEATKYPGYDGMNWLTAEHVIAQSDAMHRKLQKHGYTYINMDSGWRAGFDKYGRPICDRVKFPHGISEVAQHVHKNGQKLGIYYIPGISGDIYKANSPIFGTPYHIRDITAIPLKPANGWSFNYAIDFSKPGAQEYINSIANEFASWGVDFLKFDGVVPGSQHDNSVDCRSDVKAWAQAIKQTGRPIWLEISWNIDMNFIDYWRKYANGWRISTDVESYDRTLTAWGQIRSRFEIAHRWENQAGIGKGWNDLDSLDVGNGEMDGLTEDERKTAMTLWTVCCAPLYTGDDLTKLDSYGRKLLTNEEVIAVDQAGVPAHQVVGGNQPVWEIDRPDGSKIVALFNLDDNHSASSVIKWSDLGFTGTAQVRDLWSHKNLGKYPFLYSTALGIHESRLIKVTPEK